MRRLSRLPVLRRTHRRSGLAPLEMVMLTPFLVMMGALMICFGDAALWKIRSQAAVHYQTTQNESFRARHYDASFWMNPRPANWPRPARLGGQGGADLNDVQNLYWNQVGPEETAALQGNQGGGSPTLLVDPYMGNRFNVNRRLIADRGVHAGTADMTKKFPMMTRLLPNNGTYRVDHDMIALQGDWYFNNVGLGSNSSRRALHLYNRNFDDPYNLTPSTNTQLSSLWDDFEQAYNDLLSNPNKADLDILDRDMEWPVYHPGSFPPDFHPPRPTGCEIELMVYVTSGAYENYLERIRRVPLRMAQAWYSTYYGEWSRRQNDPLYVPRGPLSDAELQDRYTRLQSYINLLRANGFQ